MDKKIWVVSPVFYIVSVAMAVMACLSLPFSLTLFIVNFSVSIISSIIIYLNIKGFQNYIDGVVRRAMDAVGVADIDFLQRIPIPTVLVGKVGEIVHYNMLFRDVVGKGRGRLGETILQFLAGETLNDVLAKNGVDVAYNGRNYTVYGSQFDDLSALYFIECTEY